jgi:hypothetical protein
MIWVALALAGSDGQPSHAQQFTTPAGYRWALQEGELTRDDQVVVDRVHGPVAVAQDRVVLARLHTAPVHTELVVVDRAAAPRVLPVAGDPSRVALSPDGQQIAWVSTGLGFASVWVSAIAPWSPVQLTNVDLVRRKGRAPQGFVPPPSTSMHFEGGQLVWRSEAGEQRVDWR